MSWETKFASIVQETENNLAKVKEKLRYKSTHSPVLGAYEKSSSELSTFTNCYPAYSAPKTRLKSQWTDTDDMYNNTCGISQRRAMHLQEKIDEQDKTIEQLKVVVETLQKERGEYRGLTKKLSSEVSQLTSQVVDHSNGPDLQWQMSQMKREMSFDVREVKNQLELFRSQINKRTSSDHTSDHTSQLISRNEQLAQDVHENVNYLRKEVNTLRIRLESMEIGMMSGQYSTNSSGRPAERPSRIMHETPDERTQRRVEILRTCPDADRSMDRMHMNQLRHTVQSLKDQLSNVETRILSTPTAMKSYSKASKPRRSFLTRTRVSPNFNPDFHINSDWGQEDLDVNDSSDARDSDSDLISTFVSKRSSSDNVHMDVTSPDPSDDEVVDDTLLASLVSLGSDEDDLHNIDSLSIDEDSENSDDLDL